LHIKINVLITFPKFPPPFFAVWQLWAAVLSSLTSSNWRAWRFNFLFRPEGSRRVSSQDYTSMDPPRSISPPLDPDSAPIPTKETPPKVILQPSFSKIFNLDLINFNFGPSTNYFAPLPEELLNVQYRNETTEQERQWDRSTFPQRKKIFLRNIRQKTLNHTAPYQVEREGRLSCSHDKDQNRCKCHYCGIEREDTSRNSKRQNSSSWKVLIEGLSHLALSPGTIKTGPLSDLPNSAATGAEKREEPSQEAEKVKEFSSGS
jgi:hypothetical protein